MSHLGAPADTDKSDADEDKEYSKKHPVLIAGINEIIRDAVCYYNTPNEVPDAAQQTYCA
jgi:hypothetical protein